MSLPFNYEEIEFVEHIFSGVEFPVYYRACLLGKYPFLPHVCLLQREFILVVTKYTVIKCVCNRCNAFTIIREFTNDSVHST